MIWYFLYPLRGTTEPPRLSRSHPIRRALQAHGTATARHWLLSILITITISVLFCYQAVFQPDSSVYAGLRNLPKHVWTSTTPIESERPPDVVVRQVWVEGDFMKAITLDVLRTALEVQDALIGAGFESPSNAYGDRQIAMRDPQECMAVPEGEKWGWHSPLLYWDCCLHSMEEDTDLLRTINARSKNQTALNLTLRPSTVFAGKRFASAKLTAADALVITLFDQTNSSIGHQWDSRSGQLARKFAGRWDIFPNNGYIDENRLYEFRLDPMTIKDDLFLAASYIITAVYVVWKMKQLRAIKSWLGLIVTICAKMTICIIASFTVCTYLEINLARIPRPWFPAVVFCFGLGNIFRLINVVLETPPEIPPHQRIGNALGEVGHLSLAIACQNLALIYLCSRIVTPWVADFCVFAAVTLVFDLVFHLTFFVAVLSVDVQRMELSDSLQRIDFTQAPKKIRQGRQTWLSAVREGNLPGSTRFAGTAAIFSIILTVNWHFFDTDESITLKGLAKFFPYKKKKGPNVAGGNEWSAPPMHQARTPSDWLKIQDHNTARELFAFIKPGARSFIARIYKPLIIVQKNAQGRAGEQPASSLQEFLRRFTQSHAFPAALIVVLTIAGVTLLTNYLLWTGLPEASDGDGEKETDLCVKSLNTAQALDVVRLASCSKGHLAIVSLDRSTAIWLHGQQGYLHRTLQTAAIQPKLWPIYASAMDDSGSLLAICADTGQLGLWSITASRFLMFPKVDIREQPPLLFSFMTLNTQTEVERLRLVIVTPDGFLTEVHANTGIHHTTRICSGTIVRVILYTSIKGHSDLIFLTRTGEVYSLSLTEHGPSAPAVIASLDPGPPSGRHSSDIKCLAGVPTLGLLVALRDEVAEIVDFNSQALIHTLPVGHVRPQSFRVLHAARRVCACGAPAVHSLSVAYAEHDADHMIMQTFTLDEAFTSQICLGTPAQRTKFKCRGLDLAKEAVHSVEPADIWESIDVLNIVGIRKCAQSPTPSSTSSDDEQFTADASTLESALKKRARKQNLSNSILRSLTSRSQRQHSRSETEWEAWSISSTGEFHSRPLCPDDSKDMVELSLEEDLFVAAPGPITTLGKSSIAVGFGNTIKIVTIGKEVFNSLTMIDDGRTDLNFSSYKWRGRTRGAGKKHL